MGDLMAARKDPTLEEIRARVAKRAAAEAAQPTTTSPPEDNAAALAVASARFTAQSSRSSRAARCSASRLSISRPISAPRCASHVCCRSRKTCSVNGTPSPEYRELVDELQALGRSLKERQIQPIIVYAGTSTIYPAARYLILVGHRRWTGAHLAGLEALDAIVVDPPSQQERVRLQYIENDEREDFSDMERAWALQQMRQALGERATWEDVETHLKLSNARRNQLTRLRPLSPPSRL